jgi:hypothetical protein
MSPPLAHAFLALSDADACPNQRTVPRMVAAAAAAVALALGGPLALLCAQDHPVASLSSKFSLTADPE